MALLAEQLTLHKLCRRVERLHARSAGRLAKATLDEEDLHCLRVDSKRFRAAWRLLDWEFGFPERAQRVLVLSEAARLISPLRDAAIRGKIAARHGGSVDREDLEVAVPPGLGSTLQDAFSADRAAWKEVRRALGGQVVGSRALVKACIQARRRGALAVNSNNDERWHDWRKAVKNLLYQIEWVAGRSLGDGKKRFARLRELGKALGRRNDLAVYQDWLLERGEPGAAEIVTRLGRGFLREERLAKARFASLETGSAADFVRPFASPA